ncbi:MAG: hypothetical protein ACD_72C00001G0003 [uncultured bacterium]|nr:MAG: hypothetical protein ACD_72C00001G0003 [uncultured bacterium]
MWLLIIQSILFDAIVDIFYFPLWWYTGGVLHSLKWCVSFFLSGNQTLAPGLWLKNIFVPMFGQYDWQGRIISFFMRFIQVCLRSIALFIWLLVCVVLFFVWLSLPVFVVIGFIMSFSK